MQSIEDLPSLIAGYWGITTAAAQVMLSLVVIMTIILPVLIMTKGRNIPLVLAVFFITECFLVGIQWLDFWVLIGTLLMMALAWASLGSGAITGER